MNEAFAAELMAGGIPEDVARFFAAQRVEVIEAVPGKYHFRQTFPNGAKRDVTYTFGATENYVPTPEQLAWAAQSGVEIYPIAYTGSAIDANPVNLELTYFVPYTSMPADLVAELTGTAPTGGSNTQSIQLGLGAGDGTTVIVQESAETGADTLFSSIVDYYADNGTAVQQEAAKKIGGLFALASALSDVAGAADLSKEHKTRIAELELLKKCALNPTNPLTASDPVYSANAVAAVDAAMTNVKLLTAARFLNKMVDTSAGIHPALGLLQPGITWNEQTLSNLTETTEMHDARAAVVACDYPMNVTVTYSHTNHYDKCDNICHGYDQKLTLSASFQMVSLFPGGSSYFGTPDGASIALEDVMTFTHTQPLNPPYQKSHSLKASGPPNIDAQMMSLPTGREVTVKADTTVQATYSQTGVGSVNGTPTEQTTDSPYEAYMEINCKFSNVSFSGGEYTGVVTQTVPFDPNDPNPPGNPARSCKIKLTPVPPP